MRDYGAVGDGVTNDTAALQAALNSGRSSIYFPAGTYITSLLSKNVTYDLTLRGDGPGSSTLKRIDNNSPPIQKMVNLGIYRAGVNVSLSDLTVDANGTNQANPPEENPTAYQSSAAISITAQGYKAGNVTVENCDFKDNTADGLRLAATGAGGFADVVLSNNTGSRTKPYVRGDLTITANFDTLSLTHYTGDSFEIETEEINTDYENIFSASNVSVRSFDVNIKDAVTSGVFPAALVHDLTIGADAPISGLYRRFNLSNVDAEMYDFDITVDQQIYAVGQYDIYDGSFAAGNLWIDTNDNNSESLINEKGTEGGTHKFHLENVTFSADPAALSNSLARYYRSDRVAPTSSPLYAGALFASCDFTGAGMKAAYVANGTYEWSACSIAWTGSGAAIECGNLDGYLIGPDDTYHTVINTVAAGNLYSTDQHDGAGHTTDPLTLVLSGNTVAGTEVLFI